MKYEMKHRANRIAQTSFVNVGEPASTCMSVVLTMICNEHPIEYDPEYPRLVMAIACALSQIGGAIQIATISTVGAA
jgi:hypothetical protein